MFLRRVPIVVAKQATESFAAPNLASRVAETVVWFDQPIAQALMTAFLMIMSEEMS